MDLNDPRKRLQVLNNSNPSLRVSVSPQPKVTVAAPQNQPRLFVGNQEIPQSPTAQTSIYRPPKPTSLLDKVNSFSDTAADKIGGGFGRGAVRGLDFVLPGKNTFGLEGFANEWDRRAQQSAAQQADQTYAEAGKKFGSTVKGVGDIGLLFSGAAAAEQAASKIPMLANTISKLQQGGKISRVAAKTLGILPGSLTGSGIDVVQTAGRGDKQNVGKSLGIGTAIDLAIPVLGKGVSKGFNLFKGKGSKSFSFIDDIIGETSPESIQKVMGNVDHSVAEYLAGETDPAAIKQVLQQMALDPNIKLPDDVVKRLEEEGISAIRRDAQSQYPAEYNTGDKSISFRDQADATADNAYHELGHHFYSNKLTPEEKALFANFKGDAYQQAVGRPGYTEADLVSEDFSDFMRKAMNGQINQVPEEVRPIIQKYARIAAAEADDIGVALPKAADVVDAPTKTFDGSGTFPRSGSQPFAPITKDTQSLIDDLAKRADSTPRIDGMKRVFQVSEGNGTSEWVFDDADSLANFINGRTNSGMKVDFYDVPEDMLSKTANGEHVFKINGAASPEAVAQVSKAQTGVVDAPIQTADDVVEGTGDASQVANVVNENADEAVAQFEKSADEMFPGASPEDKVEIQKVMDSLKEAKTNYAQESADFSKRRGAALYRGDAKAQEAGGMAGYKEQLKALKNVTKDSNFQPVDVSEGFRDRVLTSIQKSEKLLPGEKLNRSKAVLKLFGEVDGTPTPREQKLIREVMGNDVADLVDEAIEQAKSGMTVQDILEQVASAPRTQMTVLDASAPRQLATSFTSHPIVTTKNYLKSFEHMFRKGKFEQATEAMASMTDASGHNYSEFMDSVMNIHLPNVAEKAAEESMSAAPLLSKIPLWGRVVDASNRGMSSAVGRTRFELAKNFIDNAGGVEEVSKLFPENELADLGEVFQTITGRGGKAGGFTDRHASILSKTLFSGKLWASRFNMLNPYWYARLSPPARKEAIRSAASFAATAGVVLTLIDQMPGVEVGKDRTSADWLKIKVGNTRFDLLGGFQQNLRVASQIQAGERTNSMTGDTKPVTAGSVLGGLIEGKANPLLGVAYKLMNTLDDEDSSNPFARKDEWGNEVNTLSEVGSLGVPLPVSGAKETIDDQGAGKGIAFSLPGFFGAGVQTYGDIKTKDQGKPVNGFPSFKGKVTPEMVLDNEGNPMIDAKGKPIKVKFDDTMTDMEKTAITKEKQKSAYRDLAKRNMSPDDRGIYKMGEADKDSLNETQLKKYNQLKKYVENYGQSAEIPQGAKSTLAKNFYQKYNTMSKEDQKAWLKESPDETAKTITGLLNKERSKGLSEFKPSNAVAKAYAEYEDDINSHPEYTEIDKRNKAKEFQKFTYKLNYSTDQKDLYNEGSSSDVRYLLDQKQIAKKDLDEAIKMDDELYNSGLVGSLKFSKKFRKEYGYGLPTGGGFNENPNASGGGDGDATPKTGITSLLPSFKTANNGGDTPKFSSKRRTTGISFKNVSTSKPSSKPKVTIKL